MTRKLKVYSAIEAVLGRQRTWKLGRFLYFGARRELHNHPEHNGEYRLIGWALDAHRASGASGPVTVLDVGANIGEWSERAAREIAARPGLATGARLVAFEPASAQRESLRQRLAGAGGAITVDIRDSAVGAAKGRVRFAVTGDSTGTSGIVPGGTSNGAAREVEVEVVALDDLGLGDTLLVKVDTEGNDFNVICGARRLLEEKRIGILQFEYNWRWIDFGHTLHSVYRFAEGLDYAIGALTQDGIELHGAWHPELDRFTETNYVLVRRDLVARLPHTRVAFDAANTLVEARA